MKKRRLGTSELYVSELGLGCMSIGTEEKTAYELAKRISNGKPVGKISIHEVHWPVPSNVSFNLDKLHAWRMRQKDES